MIYQLFGVQSSSSQLPREGLVTSLVENLQLFVEGNCAEEGKDHCPFQIIANSKTPCRKVSE